VQWKEITHSHCAFDAGQININTAFDELYSSHPAKALPLEQPTDHIAA
jgi:hypothetical protein